MFNILSLITKGFLSEKKESSTINNIIVLPMNIELEMFESNIEIEVDKEPQIFLEIDKEINLELEIESP